MVNPVVHGYIAVNLWSLADLFDCLKESQQRISTSAFRIDFKLNWVYVLGTCVSESSERKSMALQFLYSKSDWY